MPHPIPLRKPFFDRKKRKDFPKRRVDTSPPRVEIESSMIHKLITISEVVGVFEENQGRYEVCATADAYYDETPAHLVIHLDSFIRAQTPGSATSPASQCLPEKQTITESVSHSDAIPLAKDIFGRWVRKVRQSIPEQFHLHFS